MKNNIFLLISIISVFLLTTTSCEKDTPNIEKQQFIYDVFEEYYLWYEHLPKVNLSKYTDLDELVEDLKYKEIDQWSYTTTYQEFVALYLNASTIGFGGRFIWDTDNKLKTSFSYTDSPFGSLDVGRGWIIKKINDVAIDDVDIAREQLGIDGALKFEFEDLSGETHTHTITPAEYTINTVLFDSIYQINEQKIGYVVFNRFLRTAENDLTPIFDEFASSGIDELIVDLRYNVGGQVDQALQMLSNIGGMDVAERKVGEYRFNDKREDENEDMESPESKYELGLDKVVFITSSQSASASELLINMLDPFMEVTTVGTNTHGKPVGMEVIWDEELDLVVAPISFKNVNIEGYGDFYDGLEADILTADDLDHDWGDTEELCLKAALNFLSGGVVIASKSAPINRATPIYTNEMDQKGLIRWRNQK